MGTVWPSRTVVQGFSDSFSGECCIVLYSMVGVVGDYDMLFLGSMDDTRRAWDGQHS